MTMTTNQPSASERLPKIHLDKTLVGRLEALAASVTRRAPDDRQRGYLSWPTPLTAAR
jgi:hypothetical protein